MKIAAIAIFMAIAMASGIEGRRKRTPCSSCKVVFRLLKLDHPDLTAANAVNTRLPEYCTRKDLQEEFKPDCKDYLPKVMNKAWEMFNKRYNQKKVCSKFGFCNPRQRRNTCDSCHATAHRIWRLHLCNESSANTLEAARKHCLNEFNSRLFQSNCTATIQNILPGMLNSFENGEGTDAICNRHGFCNDTSSVALAVASGKENAKKMFGTTESCDSCKKVFKLLMNDHHNHTGNDAVNTRLPQYCAREDIDKEFKTDCEDYLPKVMNTAWKMFDNGSTQEEVCLKFGFCNPNQTRNTCDSCHATFHRVWRLDLRNETYADMLFDPKFMLCYDRFNNKLFQGNCGADIGNLMPRMRISFKSEGAIDEICKRHGYCGNEFCFSCKYTYDRVKESYKGVNQTGKVHELKNVCKDNNITEGFRYECNHVLPTKVGHMWRSISIKLTAQDVCNSYMYCLDLDIQTFRIPL